MKGKNQMILLMVPIKLTLLGSYININKLKWGIRAEWKNSLIINARSETIEEKKPSIFFSIHHSNWEICVPTLDRMGISIGAIYRHINKLYFNFHVYICYYLE